MTILISSSLTEICLSQLLIGGYPTIVAVTHGDKILTEAAINVTINTLVVWRSLSVLAVLGQGEVRVLADGTVFDPAGPLCTLSTPEPVVLLLV